MKNILNEVIRENNVQMLGEMVAIKALKTVASHSNGKLDYIYTKDCFSTFISEIRPIIDIPTVMTLHKRQCCFYGSIKGKS